MSQWSFMRLISIAWMCLLRFALRGLYVLSITSGPAKGLLPEATRLLAAVIRLPKAMAWRWQERVVCLLLTEGSWLHLLKSKTRLLEGFWLCFVASSFVSLTAWVLNIEFDLRRLRKSAGLHGLCLLFPSWFILLLKMLRLSLLTTLIVLLTHLF
jgi:hypothetical protein